MKLHYSKILLFVIPLNILVTSLSNLYNKNKPYITTRHTPIYTSRVLSEKDTQSSRYDNDEEIKSVKEIFDRQTSQRLREYDERLQEKRQKRKEQRDKKTQEIIEKDKMDKSLAEKIEKCCLRCGCGLGGVSASVGIFGAVAVKELTKASMIAATNAGIKEGVKVGLANVMKIVKQSLAEQRVLEMPTINVADLMAVGKFNDGVTLHGIFECIYNNINGELEANGHQLFSTTVKTMAQKSLTQFNHEYSAEAAAVVTAFDSAKTGVLAEGTSKTSTLTTGITATVVTIVVIVLIMVIIYLILRYRRKKKMKKKLQYTKLLKQ
ncbi:rifin PIR protein, putative [Plasmodium reichenowi]|uniref:Rifin PIR protein, putative n=1 Tax=Plasmodium reichenowi TaxID=5854 RepID=A0A2P9D3Z4_PLARE|nr:rifin PIR protein, putative [Plasmodium reichenowi]